MKVVNYDSKTYPRIGGGYTCITGVAVQDCVGTFAVYAGDIGEPCGIDEWKERCSWLAQNGTKCTYREAQRYFPTLKEEVYRK